MKWLGLAVLLAVGVVVGPLLLLMLAASVLSAAACSAMLAFVGAVFLKVGPMRSGGC